MCKHLRMRSSSETNRRTDRLKPNLSDLSDLTDLTDLQDLTGQQQKQKNKNNNNNKDLGIQGFRDIGI